MRTKISFYLLILLLSATACKHQETIADKNVIELQQKVNEYKTLQASLNADYQKLPAFVQYYKEPGLQTPDFASQNLFIESSGLPMESEFYSWSKDHSVDDAIKICKSFIAANETHKYINVFKQYSGWLLITRFDMLSGNAAANSKSIAYLTNNLIEAKYAGYNLLYNCLVTLDKNESNKSNVKAFSKTIIAYSDLQKKSIQDSKNQVAKNSYNSKPIDPRIQEKVDKYLEEKNNNDKYIEEIKQLSNS